MEATNSVTLSKTLKNGLTMTIRNLTPEDAEEYIQYMQTVCGESDNLTFCPEDFTLSPEKARGHIADFHKDGRSVMLAGVLDGRISAVSTLRCQGRRRIRHNAEFSLTVLKKYWNVGAGDAMLGAIAGYARSRGDIRNIELGVKATNANAIHLYEKHGFVTVGVHKDSMLLDGGYCDSLMMDLHL